MQPHESSRGRQFGRAHGAIEASDLTLVSGDLRAAADAIRLSRAPCAPSSRTSAGPSATTSPLSLDAGDLLNPLIAGAAMALSSRSVVANALRLRRFRSAHSMASAPALNGASPGE